MSYAGKMNQEKSTTPELDLDKIKRFTELEIKKLSNGSLPLCYQIGITLYVGENKIFKVDKYWELNGIKFYLRRNAIYYGILLHQKKDTRELIKLDETLESLEYSAILYRSKYRDATDDWKRELYSNKYNETMLRIRRTKLELKNITFHVNCSTTKDRRVLRSNYINTLKARN